MGERYVILLPPPYIVFFVFGVLRLLGFSSFCCAACGDYRQWYVFDEFLTEQFRSNTVSGMATAPTISSENARRRLVKFMSVLELRRR
ncbi:hypothetical protein M569_00717 [Genlisea aurea]|uniref:Uncharacterized protein n=1 Tax=Genlisea aurea TaxID=192259 RepID=S8EDK4_9LAMI|nr:hypothetical protein M569_00717 [Genlisea aurea]